MRVIPLCLGVLLLLPVAGVRLLFLCRGRLGWIFYLANVFSELFVKKIGWPRGRVEAVLALAGILTLRWAGAGWTAALVVALLLAALELYVRATEILLLKATYCRVDRIGLRHATPENTRGLASGYPAPSAHPQLTINLIGPFVERTPRYDLGTLAVGRHFQLNLIIGNHTLVPTQTAIRVRIISPPALDCHREFEDLVPRLSPGDVHELTVACAVRGESKAGMIRIIVEWGDLEHVAEVWFARCAAHGGMRLIEAAISRYPGACRSAFAWRGDMDLYDESTLQSIQGLETTLALAARYRMPQTMFLSTRLSLDESEARQWEQHYGLDRGASRIPEFIQWLRDNVEFRHACSYPFKSSRRFLLELGNHGHLHFGTDASAAPGNQWTPKAKMGAGVYPWLSSDRSSLAEQRDNALEARRWCEHLFDFSPKSWAMPDRTNDRYTAAAMEAAGCEVLSDSDVSAKHNVILQPPPHHPPGTKAVELTKRYPGDSQHVYHVAMNLFWLHRAHRKGIPIVFMCHQHLRQFHAYACARFTEFILRYAIGQFHGDFHINTVYGVGKYWREALSPQTARVRVSLEGDSIRVSNQADCDLVRAPVDVSLASGRFTLLVSVPARSEVLFNCFA